MSYRIRFLPSALRQFEVLPRKVKVRMANRIDSLALDPRQRGCIKLSGGDNTYRLRSGDYRVLYQIHDEILLVIIAGVGHRKKVYSISSVPDPFG